MASGSRADLHEVLALAVEGRDHAGASRRYSELLEILACPVCKTPVELVKDGAGLRCAQCKRVYPVQNDIPVMLVDEATVED